MKKYYVGLDVGGTNLKGAVFDKYFVKLGEHRIPTEVKSGSVVVLERMNQLLGELFRKTGAAKKDIHCIGVGVPGLLDAERGISLFSPNFPDWENVPVGPWLKEQLGVPVFIDNDVRMNLYGEWYFGGGRDLKNIVLLTLGTGFGAGVVMDGRVLQGATSSAAEVGHMRVLPGGRPCNCGSDGCLGRYVSALGILRTFHEKIGEGRTSMVHQWVDNDNTAITAKMLSRAYDLGDPVALETFWETGEILGMGLANVINLFNPEVLIVGGGMSAAGERLLGPARTTAIRYAMKIPQEKCELMTAELGDSAGMAGAAMCGRARLENRKLDGEPWWPSII